MVYEWRMNKGEGSSLDVDLIQYLSILKIYVVYSVIIKFNVDPIDKLK